MSAAMRFSIMRRNGTKGQLCLLALLLVPTHSNKVESSFTAISLAEEYAASPPDGRASAETVESVQNLVPGLHVRISTSEEQIVCADVLDQDYQFLEDFQDLAKEYPGLANTSVLVYGPTEGDILYSGGERLSNHPMGYNSTYTSPGCSEFPAVMVVSLLLRFVPSPSIVLMLGFNNGPYVQKLGWPELRMQLQDNEVWQKKASLRVPIDLMYSFEVFVPRPGWQRLHAWIFDESSKFWDEKRQRDTYMHIGYATSGQFEMRSHQSELKVSNLEEWVESLQQSTLAGQVQAARRSVPDACHAPPSRSEITVFTIAHHVSGEYDVKMLLERLLGIDVRWIEEGQHWRCGFRKHACGTFVDLMGPTAIAGPAIATASSPHWHINVSQNAPKAFFEQFQNQLASVDIFLCAVGPFNCFLYERFNKPIVLYILDEHHLDGHDKVFQSWLHGFANEKKNMIISAHPYLQKKLLERFHVQTAYVPMYGVHSTSRWTPATNHFLVHVGRSHDKCSKLVARKGICLEWATADFQDELFKRAASKVHGVHLSGPIQEYMSDQNDGTGTWEKYYSKYAGLVYFPYSPYTLHVAQTYRLQIPTFVPSIDLLKSWGNMKAETWYHFNAFRPGTRFFDNLDHLFEQLRTADLVAISMEMRITSNSHCDAISSLWRTFLSSAGATKGPGETRASRQSDQQLDGNMSQQVKAHQSLAEAALFVALEAHPSLI